MKTTEDYRIASRDVNPWLTALSAVATNDSGFIFLGMFGFTANELREECPARSGGAKPTPQI